jgi:hypothetical protein
MQTSHSSDGRETAPPFRVVAYPPHATNDQAARRIARKYLLPLRVARLIVDLAGIGGRAA